jgi:hypothetical protein
MDHPYRFRGSRRWEKDGVSASVEPVGWEQTLGLEPDGTLKLTQERAVELALANSRDYQTSLEAVYATALALTLNRFEFDSRWFGRNNTLFTQTGFAGPPTISTTLDSTNGLGFNRNLAAGGQVLVDFANSFVWEYSSGTSRVTGGLTAALVQPLLRNFGRKVRLETLTQAERDTLYAVRDFARFRKQFWVATAVDSGGYLSLLLQQQSVRNAQANLRSQEENYRLGLELQKGNKKSAAEVDAIFQGLLAARQQVVNAETGLQEGWTPSSSRWACRRGCPSNSTTPSCGPSCWSRRNWRRCATTSPPSGANGTRSSAGPRRGGVAGEPRRAVGAGRQGRPALDAADADLKRWREEIDRPSTGTEDAERRERVTAAHAQQAGEVATQRTALAALVARLKLDRDKVGRGEPRGCWRALSRSATQLGTIVETAVSAQTQARIHVIRLPDVEVVEAAAVAQAKANRLDLQNRLAQVTDAWRKVTVAGNQLRSDFNLVANVNLVTDLEAGHPLDFSKDLSRYSVGVQFDGPLNRLAERNQYRLSLIAYQRARRDYMELSDRIEAQIRSDLRSLRLQRFSFEIARQSLVAAARQLENEQLLLTAPNQPPGGGAGDATLRKLRALDQLLAAREQLAGSFIRYEQQRVRLLLDLEELQLDERGVPVNVRPAASVAPGPVPAPSGPR